MARMYGRIGATRNWCACCDNSRGKGSIKAQEERRWRSEALAELDEHPDQYWLFLSPTS